MRKLRVALGDLSYFNRYTEFGLYAPLNIGFLASYAQRRFGAEVESKLFKDPNQLLEYVRTERPDVVGLSFYYWNTALNHLVTRRIRAMLGDAVTIVWGGPSVDSDAAELSSLCRRYPEVDAFVPNEGELGFTNILAARLAGGAPRLRDAVDGAVFVKDGTLVQGRPVGLTLDLEQLGSPYLNGFLDPFLNGQFLPIVQTSRLCPYTCAFCVSGKNRGKLRAFPLEQVRAELDYVCSRYADRPEFTMYISDENFGILKRDVEVAEHIRACAEKYGFPRKVFYYNDKRFTDTSRQVQEILGSMCLYGLTLSLQSENPETLSAINRRNLTHEQRDAAIKWASDRGFPVTTELIFGLPAETRRSFVDVLNRCATVGFDSVQCYNLIIFDGIELNRQPVRARHGLETRWRHVSASYQTIAGEFCAEAEEVVVASKSFDFGDYLAIRGLNLMFYAIFYLKTYHWFFKYVASIGTPLADFLTAFLEPDAGQKDLPEGYLRFLQEFQAAVKGELFETKEAVTSHMKAVADASGDGTAEPVKITPHFGMRLLHHESAWLGTVLRRLLDRFVVDADARRTALALLDLCERERIDLRRRQRPEPLETRHDVLAWRRDKFRRPLDEYGCPPRLLHFAEGAAFRAQGTALARQVGRGPSGHFAHQESEDLYLYALGHFILSPADLLYELSYDESAEAVKAPRGDRAAEAAVA